MRVIDLPGEPGLVAGEVILNFEKKSQTKGDFFGIYHLAYRIRPPPRPP
jgi:hypothetical protein